MQRRALICAATVSLLCVLIGGRLTAQPADVRDSTWLRKKYGERAERPGERESRHRRNRRKNFKTR
jgi:hypothetical protein